MNILNSYEVRVLFNLITGQDSINSWYSAIKLSKFIPNS